MTTPSNTAAIETATGLAWQEWVDYLETHGGAQLDHRHVVHRVKERMPATVKNPDWWAQSVAVAYAQHVGHRVPGQRQDGHFEVSVSKTIAGTRDEVMATWLGFIDDRDNFAGSSLAEEPTTTSTQKWRRWRGRLEDGTRVGVDIGERGGKSVLTVTHGRLRTREDLEQRRDWWKQLLDGLELPH